MNIYRSKSVFYLLVLFTLLASLLGGAVFVTPAHAAGSSIIVNSSADTVADDGTCTLREAITNANNDSQLYATAGECAAGDSGGTDAITFAGNYTITLGSQLPVITSSTPPSTAFLVTITGNGPANTIIRANATPATAAYRVFEVSATGQLYLYDLSVQNGNCVSACAGYTDSGGGILNAGTLGVRNIAFTGNAAAYYGGAIYNVGYGIDIWSSTFSSNTAGVAGGAIANASEIFLMNNTFWNNTATGGNGGGIFNVN